MRCSLRIIVLGAFAMLATFQAAAQEARSDAEIERIVRDYLMREPEIIYEAIQQLQARQQAAEAERRRETLSSLGDEIFNDPNDPVAGNAEGSVTLVEFFDYQCSYCRRMAPAMQALLEEDEDLRLVFKELPVLGPDSMVAARAGLAASRIAPEHYMDFHFALMNAGDLSEPTILETAEKLGIDPERLKTEMDGSEVAEAIQTNLQIAGQLGINGTPSFIVGDTIVPGAMPIAQLSQLISQERDRVRPADG